MSLYVLNKHSDLSPPFHLTVDDVNMERIPTRSHQDPSLVTGFSEDFWNGERAVPHQLNERENTSWETEQDLGQYGNVVERYWAGEPKQVGGENAKY